MLYHQPILPLCRLDLLLWIRHKGRYPSQSDRLETLRRREELRKKLDNFFTQAKAILGVEIVSAISGVYHHPPEAVFDEDDESLMEVTVPGGLAVLPETTVLPLPSSVPEDIQGHIRQTLLKHELQLRRGQANDCLQALRLAIGQKSFLYREGIRPASRKSIMLKSKSSVVALSAHISLQCQIYSRTRSAMISLGISANELENVYQVISKDDVQTSTKVVRPNDPGHSQDKLSWIWTTCIPSHDNGNHLIECECPYFSVHLPRLTDDSLSGSLATCKGPFTSLGGRALPYAT